MALIQIGIHENLILTGKTKINDKGTLELGIKVLESKNAVLEAFENNTTFSSMESSFRFYPPSLLNFDKNSKTSAELASELLVIRAQFRAYALLFGTKDEVDAAIGGITMFTSAGIETASVPNVMEHLDNEKILAGLTTSLSKNFLTFLQSKHVLDNEKLPFRQKFLRQSMLKNFAVIPKSTYETWIEPMTVPKAVSKIAFSDWEKDNNKDNPNPVVSDETNISSEDMNKAKNLFGNAPTTSGESLPESSKQPNI